jgi:hypothetical protein
MGVTPENMRGTTDFEYHPAELAEKYRADDKAIMDGEVTRELDEKYVRDGVEYTVHTVKIPMFDDKGSVVGIIGISWDISEQTVQKQKLKEQLDELLEFQRLTVGRELRMEEVEAQNLALEQRVEQLESRADDADGTETKDDE